MMSTNGNAALATTNGGGRITERMLHAIKTGDLGKFTPEEQLSYLLHECERMGLDPAARPFEFVTWQGKTVLYARRIAGDMLAAKHKITVSITDGPRALELGESRVLYARAKATMPDGRSVEDVGTLPLSDLVNGVMKVVTKACRRATLRICGWGGLDESELDTIPGAQRVDVTIVENDSEHPALVRLRDKLCDGDTCHDFTTTVGAFNDLAEETNDPDVRSAAKQACLAHLEETLGITKHRVKFQSAILEAERTRNLARGNQSNVANAVDPEAIRAKADVRLAEVMAARPVDPLESFRTALLTVNLPSECVAIWVKSKHEIAKLSPELRKTAWAELVSCCESAGQKNADAWLKAALKGPRDDGPKGGGKRPDATPANESDDPERDAIQGEGDGDLTAALTESIALAKWKQKVAEKRDKFELANSWLKHKNELIDADVQDEALRVTVRALMSMLGTDSELQALAFIRSQQAKRKAA